MEFQTNLPRPSCCLKVCNGTDYPSSEVKYIQSVVLAQPFLPTNRHRFVSPHLVIPLFIPIVSFAHTTCSARCTFGLFFSRVKLLTVNPICQMQRMLIHSRMLLRKSVQSQVNYFAYHRRSKLVQADSKVVRQETGTDQVRNVPGTCRVASHYSYTPIVHSSVPFYPYNPFFVGFL